MADLLQKLRAQREHQVDVEPGRWIKYLRPLAAQMPGLRSGITPEMVAAQCTSWNLTEADLLGAAVGSSDVAVFTPDVVLEALSDRPEWLQAVTAHLIGQVNAWFAAREEQAKN